jgi:alcohol dehydrogenase class IV
MAGVAFGNARLGNVHAMSHPLGGHYDLPHGLANAILLPYVMRFNCLANPTKFSMIAHALGENTEGLSPIEEALKSVQAVTKLLSDLGISPTLKETRAKEEGIPVMAEDAVKTGLMATNPRRSTADDIKKLYHQAFTGDL